jgi:ribosomal-protein-alanine N-acetyltransferase
MENKDKGMILIAAGVAMWPLGLYVNKMLLNFRKAEAKDIASIYEIELFSFKDPYPLEFLINLFSSPFHEMFVAEDSCNGKILAYAVIGFSLRKERALHLISFAVHPSSRKRKIGSKFLDFLISSYRGKGAKLFWLEVRESNVGAVEFYKKNGFSEIGRAKGYYGEEDAIIFAKHL